MRTIIVFFFLFMLGQTAFSQNTSGQNISLRGIVYNMSDNEPLPFATVAIYRIKDSSLVTGATTELDGSFIIPNVRAGKYILKASFVGYNTKNVPLDVKAGSRRMDLGKIGLQAGIELDMFEVKATYIPVQTIDDTVIYAADAFTPPEGSALEELIKRFPGASIDENGKITINGKEISKILVNGKKFFDDDPQMATKNLPANIVDRIQVFDQLSDQAQFTGIDDGESEQVINLIVKPDMQLGVFGNATAAGGSNVPTLSDKFVFKDDFRFNNQLNLNYFRGTDQVSIIGSFNNCNNVGFTDAMGSSGDMAVGGSRNRRFNRNAVGINTSASLGINFNKDFSDKVNVGGDYRLGYSNRNTVGKSYREDYLPDGNNNLTNETNDQIRKSIQHTLRLEVEYKINEYNSINIRPRIRYATSNEQEMNIHSLAKKNGLIINKGSENNDEKSNALNSNIGIQYRHKFQKPRRTLWISTEAGIRTGNSNLLNNTANNYYEYLEELSDTTNDSFEQEVDNINDRTTLRFRVGYTEPLSPISNLEIRYAFSQTNENTDKNTYNYDMLSQTRGNLIDSLSSFYGNRFMENRIEARIQWQIDKLNFSVGFGAYPTLSTNIVRGEDDVIRPVFNVAPTAQLSYRPSKQETMRLFYRGRSEQPTMNQLQPVPDFTNPLDIKLGNLNLAPYFNHRLRGFYNKFFPATTASIMAGIMGDLNLKPIVSVTITDPTLYPDLNDIQEGAKYTMYENADYTYNLLAHFTASTPIGRSKFVLSFNTGNTMANSKSIIDRQSNVANTYNTNNQLKISYRPTTGFDFGISTRLNLNWAKYSLQPERNIAYQTLSGGLDFNWKIVDNLIISSDFSYNSTSGYSQGYNPVTALWNAQLSWILGKSNQFIVRIRAIDLLNHNTNITRTVNSNYIEDIEYNALGRYVLIGLTYNLNPTVAADRANELGGNQQRRR